MLKSKKWYRRNRHKNPELAKCYKFLESVDLTDMPNTNRYCYYVSYMADWGLYYRRHDPAV